jgi:hypothetical protein
VISSMFCFVNRARGGVAPPPPPVRGAAVPRGTVGKRSVLPQATLTRGVPAPRARGTPGNIGYRPPLLPITHESYDDYVSLTHFSPLVMLYVEYVQYLQKVFIALDFVHMFFIYKVKLKSILNF